MQCRSVSAEFDNDEVDFMAPKKDSQLTATKRPQQREKKEED